MKIALIGNCQVRTIGACLQFLLPDADIEIVWVGAHTMDQQRAVKENIKSYSAVISHPLEPGFMLGTQHIKNEVNNFYLIPSVSFNGTLPDNLIIPAVSGSMGHGHSAIVVSSFLLGISEARCRQLFNKFIYASLGYFDRYEFEKKRIFDASRAIDFPLEEFFYSWPKHFMFDVGHPNLAPLASIAEGLALRLSGRRTEEPNWDSVAADFGEKVFVSWPLYPEIARHHGIRSEGMRFCLSKEGYEGYDLPEFIEKCYETYGKADRSALKAAVSRELEILAELLGIDGEARQAS